MKTTFVKGETYKYEVEDYNKAIELAHCISDDIESQYKTENPYIHTCVYPFRKRGDRYCVEVWMEYSDTYATDDIRVQLYFRKNWFGAARKAVEERNRQRNETNSILNLFGL